MKTENKFLKVAFSSKSDEYSTPLKLFNQLNKEFNFTLDACASLENAKCDNYYTKEDNGLLQEWENESVFCNPPYSDIKLWVRKSYQEAKNNKVIVMLIPARTDTKYFHNYIYKIAEIRFIKGRISFEFEGKKLGEAPFPSMIVIYKDIIKKEPQLDIFE